MEIELIHARMNELLSPQHIHIYNNFICDQITKKIQLGIFRFFLQLFFSFIFFTTNTSANAALSHICLITLAKKFFV